MAKSGILHVGKQAFGRVVTIDTKKRELRATWDVPANGDVVCDADIGIGPDGVEQATITLGSRTAAEHATYRIEAVDGGIGGGETGDTFAFTVFFEPEDAPVNFAYLDRNSPSPGTWSREKTPLPTRSKATDSPAPATVLPGTIHAQASCSRTFWGRCPLAPSLSADG